MTILIAGATGATGKWVVSHLLERGHGVRAVVRSPERLLSHTGSNDRLTLIRASILDLTDEQMADHVHGCDAVVSCLGHNLTFKGIYGQPRRLVTDATRRLCNAIKATNPVTPVKFVLMNTTGNRNRDLNEPISLAHRFVVALLRLLLPPHVDNEQAAEFLRTGIGQADPHVQWVA
ncbi:MAG: NAD(P)H-binding protein, partial [Saprospiraceae bacterium]|nr:NAD(P)H-binding protein [Saprospiraceae bacterium]